MKTCSSLLPNCLVFKSLRHNIQVVPAAQLTSVSHNILENCTDHSLVETPELAPQLYECISTLSGLREGSDWPELTEQRCEPVHRASYILESAFTNVRGIRSQCCPNSLELIENRLIFIGLHLGKTFTDASGNRRESVVIPVVH